MKEIYVFLDWTMTVSDLILNNAINTKKFDEFFYALLKLENALNCKAKLCIVSGANKNSASKRNLNLKNAFASKNRLDIYKGLHMNMADTLWILVVNTMLLKTCH